MLEGALIGGGIGLVVALVGVFMQRRKSGDSSDE